MAVVVTHTLFTDFLEQLGVPHTSNYSAERFAAMPFQSLFGLSKLLEEYGVATQGVRLTDKSQVSKIPVPFIAQTPDGLLIVTDVTPTTVDYMSQGVRESIPLNEFLQSWTGVALMAQKSVAAREPHFAQHRAQEFFLRAEKWGLKIGAALLFLYLSIMAGIYSHFSLIFVMLVLMFGLWLSTMLFQKTLHIHTATGDRVCGVLQDGGCDSVLNTKASSFFGLFKWSEVGLSFFGVSLLCLLVFPQFVPYLALVTACCLPFTVWSIWYQKYRAKAWCTMCVGVQSSLWLLFFGYLLGGWYHDIFPLTVEFWVLIVTYTVVLFGLNAIAPLMDQKNKS